jgi:eukaryotic-like serine/threonine-protein kinase
MQLEALQGGRYRSLHPIGSGSMGEVYLAEDTRIHRKVAIKVIRSEAIIYPDRSSIDDAARLFEQEARTIAIFNHPNILPLYDFGEEKGNGISLMYMVMPFCADGTLATWLRQRSNAGPLLPRETVHFISQAAGALQHAHDRQIVHRDVKPSNFLIRSNGEDANCPDLLLADFGIARFAAATTNTSRTIRGTPTYMAPELWSGVPVPASDQYALAIMAYEMLVGSSPFQGSLEQMMYQHIHEQPTPPSQLNRNLSSDVDMVFGIALAKRPEDRFMNISAFARALQQTVLHSSTNVEHTVEATPASNVIRATLAISTTEAMHGTSRTLTLPNGQQVNASIPAGTPNGQVLRLEGPSTSSSMGGAKNVLLLTIIVTDPREPAGSRDAVGGAPTMIGSHSWPANTRANRQGLSKGMTVLVIVLALLLGAGSVAFFAPFLLKNNAAPITPTATANVHTVNTVRATAPAQTVVPSTNPQNPYANSGTLVLDDQLLDNSKGFGWLTGANQRGATCEFRGDGYYSTQPAQGFFHSCPANNTDFRNFAFEVQMTLISGDYAGIVFCNASADRYYLFRIGVDGSYSLLLMSQANSDGVPLATGSISVNLSQANLIAAVVNGGSIGLYVNRQLIRSVNDSTYSHGHIAVFAWNATGTAAQAVFRNAKVWAL